MLKMLATRAAVDSAKPSAAAVDTGTMLPLVKFIVVVVFFGFFLCVFQVVPALAQNWNRSCWIKFFLLQKETSVSKGAARYGPKHGIQCGF